MRSHHRVSRAIVLVALVPLAGCYGLFGTRPGQSGLATKTVSRKEPPTSLFAIDNTRCLVTEDKYRATPIGAQVTCYWTADHESRVVNGGGGAAQTGRATRDRTVSGTVPEMSGRGGAAARKPFD